MGYIKTKQKSLFDTSDKKDLTIDQGKHLLVLATEAFEKLKIGEDELQALRDYFTDADCAFLGNGIDTCFGDDEKTMIEDLKGSLKEARTKFLTFVDKFQTEKKKFM